MQGQVVEIIGVPLDLGANMRGANIGPSAVRIAGLDRKLKDLDLHVIDSGDLLVPVREQLADAEAQNKYVHTIARVCEELKSKVVAALGKNRFPLIIGGDHSIAIGSIAGAAAAAKAAGETLGVVWIDAHADLNTPDSSPSGNVHGMPLSIVMGQGHDLLTKILGANLLKPQNVALIGLRNIDGKEKDLVKRSGVHYYTMRSIDERGMYTVMKEAIAEISKTASVLHLSFDLDGIDPLYAPGVSTAVTGGISYREAHLALEMLADTQKLRSAEFVELNPIQDRAHATALLTVELVQSALGKSIV